MTERYNTLINVFKNTLSFRFFFFIFFCFYISILNTLMAARHKHRLQCQTINKQNKQPCKASGILTKKGTIRCRIHGGW